MRKTIRHTLIASLVLAIAVITVTAPTPASAAASTQSIALPAYDYPTLPNLWPSIDAAGGSKVPFVIVNIGASGGPGATVNSDYTTRIAANTAKGIRSIGYVDTNYQARDINDVMAEIDRWYALYPGISGISFDRVGLGDANDVCYSAYAYNYAKTRHPNDLVVQKFGSYAAPAYEPYGDIFMNAEMDKALYDTWSLPADGFQDDPAKSNRFWHLVHSTDATDYPSVLAQTRANNAGWVYITDDVMFNPYDTIASYFGNELNDVATLPASTIPNRGITDLPTGCVTVTNDTQENTQPGKTIGTSALSNQSTTYSAPGPHKIAFSLPSGVTLSEATSTDWVCTGNECTSSQTIAPNGSTGALEATFLADCSYTSGSVTLTSTSFPARQQVSSITIAPPAGCENATPPTDTPDSLEPTGGRADADGSLANTGSNLLAHLIAAGVLIGSGTIALFFAKRR